MDDTPQAHDDPTNGDGGDLADLEAADPADAAEIAERVADRLQAILDDSEERPS